MKKVFLSIALAVTLLLTACGQAVPDEVIESKSLFVYTGRNSYDTGLVFPADSPPTGSTAYFVDYETMEKTPLCAVPNCMHTSSTCSARMVGTTPIIYDGYIYYFTDNNHTEETGKGQRKFVLDSKLYRMKLENSETEVVCSFDDSAPSIYTFTVIGGKLFFTATDCNPKYDEYGNVGGSSSHGGLFFLCSIDLRTFEYKNYGVIYDGDRQYEAAHHSSGAVIIGYSGDKLYLHYSFLKAMANESLGDPSDQFTRVYFEFDTKTEELTELENRQVYFANDEYFAYSENEKSYLRHGDDVRELDCDMRVLSCNVANNKLFYSSAENEWIDLSDMSEHSMGEYSDYRCVGAYNDCYILKKGGNVVKLTEEELRAL